MDNGRKTDETKADSSLPAGSDANETPIEFGTWLKGKRETVRVPLEEIAAITKVHITQLRMIEENHWESLPAPAFVRGFLLCYARHIGLDEDEVLRRYRKSLGKTDASFLKTNTDVNLAERPRVIASPNFKSSPAARDLDKIRPPILTPKRVLTGGVFLALLALISFLISIGKTESKKEAIVKDRDLKTEGQAAETSSPAESTASTAATSAATPTADQKNPNAALSKEPGKTAGTPAKAASTANGIQLAVRALEQTWISVRSDNQESKGQLIKVGSRLTFEAKNKIDLVFSNAGAVELELNGKKYYPPGFRGDVVKMSLPNDAEKLKEKPAIPRQVIRPAPVPAKPAATATPAPTTPPATPAKSTSTNP